MIFILRVDRKADIGKHSRQVYHCVSTDQYPISPAGFSLTYNMQEKQQDDRPDRIAVNVDYLPKHDKGPFYGQQMIQIVLGDQTENKREDDQHYPPFLSADIRIYLHCDIQSDQ